MNTVTVRFPDAMAGDVARATDILGMPSNEAFVFEMVRLALRSIVGPQRGRPYKHKPVAKPLQVRRSRGK